MLPIIHFRPLRVGKAQPGEETSFIEGRNYFPV